MAIVQASAALRHIRRLATPKDAQLTDRALLARFAKHHDEGAFLTLLQRHGAMVRGVCQRTLHNTHDAEDVFQATFLVLANKAARLRWHDSVAAWLHEVAYRLAVRTKAAAARRRIKEGRSAAKDSADPVNALTLHEAQAILHEELHHLPDSLRAPLVLCYLESATQDEAARQLGWSLRTLKRRLERGRARLRLRLTRRGLTLSAVLSTSLLTPCAATAALIQSSWNAALALTTGQAAPAVSARAADLAHGALGSVLLNKPKLLAMLLMLVLFGTGFGLTALPRSPGPEGAQPRLRSVEDHTGRPEPDRPGKQIAQPAVDRFGDPLPPGALARLGTVRFRHGGAIFGLAYSADGKMLATGSGDRDNTLRLWDAETGRELRRLQSDDRYGQLYSVAFSPDGKLVAGVGEGAFASLWDVATGKEMGRFGKRWEEVSYTVAISPDGQTLACGGRDYVVHLWDVATGKERGRLIGHEGIIGHFVFAPDGRLLASAGDDKTVRLWDPATCTEVRRLPPCPAPVVSVAFSRDGKKLAAGCRGGSVFVWEVATGKELVAINPTERKDDFLNRVAFSPDGATVVAGGTGILWDAATGKEKGRLQDHDSWVRAIAFSPDGAKVAADDSTRVRFWDAATGKSVPADEGHQAAVWTASFFPDGRTLASGARDATVRLWDSGTGKLLRTLAGRFDTDEHVSQLAVSRDGTIVAARLGRTLYAWEAATGKELFAVTRPGDWIRSLAFAPDGKTLATGSGIDDKLIRFWEARTGAELRSFGDQRGGMSALAFSPDGRWLVSVGGDAEAGSVYVWEAATGKQLHSLRVRRAGVTPIVGLPPPHVTSAAFAPRGDLLATGGWGMQVRLWDPATGKELMQLKTENGDVAAVAFSPDGQMLATVGDTGSVELWETATGQRRQAWAAHPGRCEAVAFAPDGRRLATAGFDTTVLIWDPAGLRTRTAGKLAQKLSGKDLEQLWTELASPDAARAYTAMCTLAAAPFESVAFLKDRLPPAAEVKRERVRALIADLASDQFLVRQAAYGELKDLSEKAVDGLREALRGNPPLEVSRRVESLLELARVLQPETLRRLRAVEVLGGIDSEGSRGILENLARGCPAARETQNARAALERRRTRVP